MVKNHFIDGEWIAGKGVEFSFIDPTKEVVSFRGRFATQSETSKALFAAKKAFLGWSNKPIEERKEYLTRYQKVLEAKKDEFAKAISLDTGKPRWEALSEVSAMLAKFTNSFRAQEERGSDVVSKNATTSFKPHGVAVVFGPFNIPAHLAHAHIVPALLAGNTVVYKPSEQTPNTALMLASIWEEISVPNGVFNMVLGDKIVGQTLVESKEVDAIYFTGGYKTGQAIHKACAGRVDTMLALELGGNNPLGVWEVEDLDVAVYLTINSAFITAGQRCTCARRLIVERSKKGEEFLNKLVGATKEIKVGFWTDKVEPFMGPVISKAAAMSVLNYQEKLKKASAKVLLSAKPLLESNTLISPGIVDVTEVKERDDTEVFGPLLQVIRVDSFESLIEEANNTKYGLAAGLISDNEKLFEEFRTRIKAGIINYNCSTVGASGGQPFGGVGLSGNHRPSGYFAFDYCSYPVASTIVNNPEMPASLPQGLR